MEIYNDIIASLFGNYTPQLSNLMRKNSLESSIDVIENDKNKHTEHDQNMYDINFS